MYTTFTGNSDYHPGPYNITFPAGETTVSFNISIIDDNIVEGNEVFTLSIDNNALPISVVRLAPYSVSVIIENDDSKLINVVINYA